MSIVTAMQALRYPEGRRNPYPVYEELHELGPACTIDPLAGERYRVVVHGYDAVNQVLRDPAYQVIDGLLLDKTGSKWREHPCQKALLTSMFFMNGTEHTRLRAAFSRAITARRVNAFRPKIVEAVDELMGQMAQQSTVDFMSAFAFPMPGNVICEFMGVPAKDREWFMPRAHVFADLLDLGAATDEQLKSTDEATIELTGYFGELVAARRREPREDLVSDVAQSGMDESELLASLLTFFNAGFASTSHLLGKGIPILLNHPSAIADLATGDAAAERVVDEILRLEPPTHFVVRYVVEDREIAGVDVPAGSRVLVLIGAANHDPARFPEPERFDPSRPDNRPLAFGAGIHYCLGAPLTRLEGVVAFPMLFNRFPDLQLAGDPVWTDRLTLHGYHTLPIKLR